MGRKQTVIVAGLLLVLVNAITSGMLSFLWSTVQGSTPSTPASQLPSAVTPAQGPRALSPSGQQIPVAITPGGSG